MDVLGYLIGPMWIANFVALFLAFLTVGFIGYGRGYGNYASFYLEEKKSWIQFAVVFVFFSLLFNAVGVGISMALASA